MGPRNFHQRIHWMHTIWFVLTAVLVGRLFILMNSPRAEASGGKPVVVKRWQVDAEHFAIDRSTRGRGVIRFADGQIWPASRSSPIGSSDAGQVSEMPRGQGLSLAPELVGTIGLSDKLPSRFAPISETGRTGMEYSLNDLLEACRPGVRAGQVNADSEPVDVHRVYELKSVPGADVTTTVSLGDQIRAQRLLRVAHVKRGSIVSLALPSREVRVLASANHAKSDALTAVAPGSIFKLVTAAAALDTHTISTITPFTCDGTVHLPHVKMTCWRQHGKLQLQEAIAQSCDVTFAQIGARLSRRAFLVAGQRFGLTDTGLQAVKGRSVIPNADCGVVIRQSGDDNGLLVNTAIGQEDVRLSPLHGANLAATIAMNGQYQPAMLIQSIKGQPIRSPHAIRACSAYAAQEVAKGMWQAVHDKLGTAYQLNHFSVAAKTGTAELPNGHVNAWLIGYRTEHGKPVEAFAFCVNDQPSRVAHHQLYLLVNAWLSQRR